MGCTWRPHRRSASGFLHVGEKVGELIDWWESGRVGKTHLWLGHVAPRGAAQPPVGGGGFESAVPRLSLLTNTS